jgi:hypothetical protein
MIPDVSVVLPSYNHSAFVGECVRSLLSQEGVSLEVIVCDDASTDDSLSVLAGIQDPRLRVLAHPHNRGAAAAVKPGLAMARGRYIARMSSDDVCLPGRFARQVACLDEKPGVAAVFGQPEFLDESGRRMTVPPPGFEELFTNANGPRAYWLRRFFEHGNCLFAPGAMMRREVLEKVPPTPEMFRHLPDFEYWVRLCRGHEIHVLPEKTTGFRIRAEGENLSYPSPEKSAEAEAENLAIWRYYLDEEALSTLGFPPGPQGRLAMAEWAVGVGGASRGVFAALTLLETDLTGLAPEVMDTFIRKANLILRGGDAFGLLEKKRLNAAKRALSEKVHELERLLSAWRKSWPGRWLRRKVETRAQSTLPGEGGV